MALTAPTQWQLVACGLVAHADGVLDGEECDRLMAMVEEEVDGEEYSTWLATIGDKAKLLEQLEALQPPPPETQREVLEQAWMMSIVDGERCEEEKAVIEDLAQRMGVESVQLDFWREAWTQAERDIAQSIHDALLWVLGGGAPIDDADRGCHEALVAKLPTQAEHRDALIEASRDAPSKETVIRGLGGLTKRKRRWALELVAASIADAKAKDDAARRFVELATELGMSASEADVML